MKERLEGKIVYDQDSKRFHRYQLVGEGMVGTFYLKKGKDVAKEYKVTLEPVPKDEELT